MTLPRRTFRDSVLPGTDVTGAVAGYLGLRRTSVTLRVTTWGGARSGLGAKTVVDTPLLVGATGSRKRPGQNPLVEQVTERDVAAQGGLYKARDLRVGPLTPHFVDVIKGALRLSGGTTYGQLDPPLDDASPTEVHFVVRDDGTGTYGDLYERVAEETNRPLAYFLVIRSLGVPASAPP